MATVEVKNLSYTYGKKTSTPNKALDNVSFKIDGGITGLIGHTGSGKSTLVQMLNGLLTPDEGEVILDGVNISGGAEEDTRGEIQSRTCHAVPRNISFSRRLCVRTSSSVRATWVLTGMAEVHCRACGCVFGTVPGASRQIPLWPVGRAEKTRGSCGSNRYEPEDTNP